MSTKRLIISTIAPPTNKADLTNTTSSTSLLVAEEVNGDPEGLLMFRVFIVYLYNTFAVLAVVFFIGVVVLSAEILSFWIEYLGNISFLGSLWVWIRSVVNGTASNPGSQSGSAAINALENCVGEAFPCPGLQLK
jgi:hypothetical protein